MKGHFKKRLKPIPTKWQQKDFRNSHSKGNSTIPKRRRVELFVSFGNGYLFAKQENPSSKWKHQCPTIPQNS
jgi:hypothetical protein